jgi:hypothetical protein
MTSLNFAYPFPNGPEVAFYGTKVPYRPPGDLPCLRVQTFFPSTRLASSSLRSLDRGWSASSTQIRAAKADGICYSRLSLGARVAAVAGLPWSRARSFSSGNIIARGVAPAAEREMKLASSRRKEASHSKRVRWDRFMRQPQGAML